MSDHFSLPPDASGGAQPPDRELTLVTSYLTGELPLADLMAVEERLVGDAAFRRKTQPLLDVWYHPDSFGVDGDSESVPRASLLSRVQVDRGWERFLAEERTRTPPRVARMRSSRLRSYGRVAAVIALASVPVIAVGQAVIYVSHLDAPSGTSFGQKVLSLVRPTTSHPAPLTGRPLAPTALHPLGGDSVGAPNVPRGSIAMIPRAQLTGANAQLPAIRQLGPIEARFPMVFPLSQFAPAPSIRQLANGTVLVSDRVGRKLMLFDSALSNPRTILDSSSASPALRFVGPQLNPGAPLSATAITPAAHGILSPFAGDSTLFVDAISHTWLVLGPRGEVGRAMISSGVTQWIDPTGRFAFTRDPGTFLPLRPSIWFATPRDSLPLLRISVGARRDTLTWLKVPVRTISNQQANPIPVNDDWAMLRDGSIAVVRARDFHIDWFEPDGTQRSTDRIPFDWVRLTQERKQALVDSLRSYYLAHPTNFAASVGDRMVRVTLPDIVPISLLPDYVPPFGEYTATGDADLHLWIRIFTNGEFPRSAEPGGARQPPWVTPFMNSLSAGVSLKPPTGPPVYYVIDKDGMVVDRVQVPAGWGIAGFGVGGKVYLIREKSPTEWEIVRARVR